MSDAELLDTFDELGRHLGVVDRRTVHAEGMWHQVVHLLVVARRGNLGVAVLQRRAAGKRTFPGLLDLSATGHLVAGESPVDGLREAREELGIDVDPGRVVRLGVRRIVDETVEGVNRELAHVFLLRDDRPLDAYRPDPAEVDAVVDLPVDAGLDLVVGRCAEVACAAVEHGGRSAQVAVTRADLVPDARLGVAGADDPPGYWATVLVMASRLLSGDERVAI